MIRIVKEGFDSLGDVKVFGSGRIVSGDIFIPVGPSEEVMVDFHNMPFRSRILLKGGSFTAFSFAGEA